MIMPTRPSTERDRAVWAHCQRIKATSPCLLCFADEAPCREETEAAMGVISSWYPPGYEWWKQRA
jgi:hypothetical protein